jgi:NADH dehydrogenase
VSLQPSNVMQNESSEPRVVIVGGGFGGLRAAQRLARAQCRVTLIDKRNHHVFQPLLYQVATAGLSPADIAAPIRGVLRGQANVNVVLDEVERVDVNERVVWGMNGEYRYDFLILAPGATHTYFGNDAWEHIAPGLKTLDDALEIRRRVLMSFEEAELEADEAARRSALTFVVVGGGPTGVETVGALKEIAVQSVQRDFRRVDTATARIILIEGQGRLLLSMSEASGARALEDLQKMGVEVRLNTFVTAIEEGVVGLGDEQINARTIIWAAGVKASPITSTLDAELDRAGRVIVGPDCALPNHPEVFVVGDAASLRDPISSKEVPGVAQGALQMGQYAADQILDAFAGGTPHGRVPFSYFDKGSMATIGRAKAVVDIGKRSVGGLLAWLMWCFVHVAFLVNFRSRIMVMLQWVWAYLAHVRGARLITGGARARLKLPADDVDGMS